MRFTYHIRLTVEERTEDGAVSAAYTYEREAPEAIAENSLGRWGQWAIGYLIASFSKG